MGIKLYPGQLKAIKELHNGSILCGGVGSGKSRTSLGYYFKENGGIIDERKYYPMKNPQDLYIITTARKRDTLEWEGDMAPFILSTNKEANYYDNEIVVDSWNNIGKYTNIEGAFFIFDEQRVIGSGAWVKSFYKITKKNNWILLSATPGDTWLDYIPVFVANGFYKNQTQFKQEHVIYNWSNKHYPKVDRYLNIGRLMRLRDRILVDIDYHRHTIQHHEEVIVKYDILKYKEIGRNRWDPFENKPIESPSELCFVWRRLVNSDESRQLALLELFEKHPKMIIFYSFNYELDILRSIFGGLNVEVAEWNGRKHQPIPKSDTWVYLVQYTAGAEGWNSVQTDTIVFFSQHYSYRTMEQAAGRIDRLNTPFTDLYYYHLKSKSSIDLAISRALREKKNFNASRFVKWK